MTQSVDFTSQTWTVELFEERILTVQPDGSIVYVEKIVPAAPSYTPKTAVGQAVVNAYSSVSKWSEAIRTSAWPTNSSLKSVAQAIAFVANKELSSAGDLQAALPQVKDMADRQIRLTQALEKLQRFQKNLEAHDQYIKRYNDVHFYISTSGFACPRHDLLLRRVSDIISVLKADLRRT